MLRQDKFLNGDLECVTDLIDSLLLQRGDLRRIENLNVLIDANIETIRDTKVTLICGGGSGHEPAHAGYIGTGMLSGAVLGNVFASPSIHSILAAIRVCAGSYGVLVIVKNYTGDRLNFGIAVERARSEGLKVEMVVVDDDVALAEGRNEVEVANIYY